MASPEFYRLIERMRARAQPGLRPVEALRDEMEEVGRKFRPPAEVVYTAANADGVSCEWAVPPETAGQGAILYFHGGGYGIGSPASHRHLVGKLAIASGARALSVDYRLAPEHPFPAAVDDAVTAARWLYKQGFAPDKVVFSGDSAGGGLAIAACLALRDAGDPLPGALVTMSPLTDLAKEGESMRTKVELDPMVKPESSAAYAQRYIGDGDMKMPLASPLYADHRGMPPMLILVGTWEVLLDDSTRIAERARAHGVDVDLRVWDEMIHIWPYFADFIPEGRQAITDMGNYIRGKIGPA